MLQSKGNLCVCACVRCDKRFHSRLYVYPLLLLLIFFSFFFCLLFSSLLFIFFLLLHLRQFICNNFFFYLSSFTFWFFYTTHGFFSSPTAAVLPRRKYGIAYRVRNGHSAAREFVRKTPLHHSPWTTRRGRRRRTRRVWHANILNS